MNSKDKAKFRRTSKWKNWCKYIKAQRGNKCECCGVVKKKGLQVHHKAEWDYENLSKDRFSLLCYSCHREVTRLQNIKPENWIKYEPSWVAFYARFLLLQQTQLTNEEK